MSLVQQFHNLRLKVIIHKLILVFIFFPKLVFGGWQIVGETPTARYFSDMTTIKTKGQIRTVNMYQNLRFKRSTDGAVSVEAKVEYDCKKAKHRMINANAYPGPNLIGKKLSSKNAGQSWNPTYKMSRFMYRAVCAVSSDKKDGNLKF